VRLDKLGVAIALIAGYAVAAAPFATFRANRIVAGEPQTLLAALPSWAGPTLLAVIAAAVLIGLFRTPSTLRLAASFAALAALLLLIGTAADHLTPPGNALTRLRPTPPFRILVLVLAGAFLGFVLFTGSWDKLSILKEYSARADSFWAEASKHVTLALGSLAAAVIVGIPLGILCHRVQKLRAAVLNVLNIVQTIPSIALFGILIAPLGWIAAHVPGAAEIGIKGIGMAPAFVALFLYSLLPVVANTVVGLAGVPPQANDAARGVGMTEWQRLFRVEFPLAFPVILTGVRIVLVQNIGLATIAALIGGGGFGVFVFQGIGQTAMDLVLLGAVPTVLLAFAAAIILDAAVELSSPFHSRTSA